MASFAQANNPYDQRGTDYIASLKIITEDYQSGKAKSFSQEALDYYSTAIPLKTSINTDLVSSVFKTVKGTGFDVASLINNSNASDFLKRSLTQLYTNSQSMNPKEFQQYLQAAVETVKGSAGSPAEKEAVLTALAIGNSASRSTCTASTQYGEAPVPTGVCMIAGAIGGFFIGLQACGIWCGLGGAVVGAVIFGLC